MPWFKVVKDPAAQPEGTYKQWKSIIREECKFQCVYCTINEASFGGVRNFHLDHYKPKKIFADLEHAIRNIFYACSICNSFKGADWPGDPASDFSNFSYPDPSETDYSTILKEGPDGIVVSDFIAGKYLIERLYLNRPQMAMLRKRDLLVDDVKRLVDEIALAFSQDRLPKAAAKEAMRAIASALHSISKIREIVPYEIEDAARK